MTRPVMTRQERRALAKDVAPELRKVERRLLLKSSLSLGALTMLTGCNLADGDMVDRALFAMSRFNDQVQALLFSPAVMAENFPRSRITKPFRFNAFYDEDDVPDIDGASWKMEVSGLVADKSPWDLKRLRAMPQQDQITRHICVEGWSQIGEWSGVPLGLVLKQIGADLRARYVGFKCADKYYGSIDMASALHPQTILALDFEQKPLPADFGFPMRLRIPTKLGFKNPKHIVAMFVTNTNPGGYWEDQGYNWFSGS
jgi:DMSO/TMAO reductase YedYZ molybdopterin-dependent catalytic subunit